MREVRIKDYQETIVDLQMEIEEKDNLICQYKLLNETLRLKLRSAKNLIYSLEKKLEDVK